MAAKKQLPINCAARNSVWVYQRATPPRFPGAPAIRETAHSHEWPDVFSLPEGSDVTVDLYGGAVTLRLKGATRRVYTGRFDYATYRTDEEARHAFLTLWREVERLDSSDAVARGGGVAGASARVTTTTSVKPCVERSLRRGTLRVAS
jgi:hypothetical protein